MLHSKVCVLFASEAVSVRFLLPTMKEKEEKKKKQNKTKKPTRVKKVAARVCDCVCEIVHMYTEPTTSSTMDWIYPPRQHIVAYMAHDRVYRDDGAIAWVHVISLLGCPLYLVHWRCYILECVVCVRLCRQRLFVPDCASVCVYVCACVRLLCHRNRCCFSRWLSDWWGERAYFLFYFFIIFIRFGFIGFFSCVNIR